MGATSEHSDLQPVLSGGEAAVRRAAEHARQGVKSPRSFYRERWAPSARERRKYATLFHRTDKDGDGFAEASDVRELLDRSGLDQGLLRLAWEHADRGQRGKLNWQECVVIVHLISCVVRGARMPGQHEGLPPELIAGIQTLEPPDVLIREREARSRSQSPANSRANSPIFLSASPLQSGSLLPSAPPFPGDNWGSGIACGDACNAGGCGGLNDAGGCGGFNGATSREEHGKDPGGWSAAEGFQTDGFGAGGDPFPSTTEAFASATDGFPSTSAKGKKSKKKKEGKSREASQEPNLNEMKETFDAE